MRVPSCVSVSCSIPSMLDVGLGFNRKDYEFFEDSSRM